MPAPQVTPIQRVKGLEGGYFHLKADYKDSPIREAAEAVLLEDARSTLKDQGKQEIVVVSGHDSLRRPIVGWLKGKKSQHVALNVISEHTI